jgi:uncharacterized protein (TIGR03435 family)
MRAGILLGNGDLRKRRIAGPVLNDAPNSRALKRTLLRAAAIGAIVCSAIGAPEAQAQPQAAAPPNFEVASVKPAGTSCAGRRSIDSQQVRYANFSLKGLVRDAYKVELYQIDAPQWLDSQCYDVAAKLPDGASKEQIPAMLQALLAERFRMTAHQEIRRDRVYALVAARNGPHLKESKGQSDRPQSVELHADGHMEFTSATLASFASAMSVLLALPVVDMTEIQGHFDITLNVTRGDLAGMRLPSDGAAPDALPENSASSSMFAAMQELGLKLESRNVSIQHIVVDSAEKVPTGN